MKIQFRPYTTVSKKDFIKRSGSKGLLIGSQKLYEEVLLTKLKFHQIQEQNKRLRVKIKFLQNQLNKIINTRNPQSYNPLPTHTIQLIETKKQYIFYHNLYNNTLKDLENIKRNVKLTRIKQLQAQVKVYHEQIMRLKLLLDKEGIQDKTNHKLYQYKIKQFQKKMKRDEMERKKDNLQKSQMIAQIKNLKREIKKLEQQDPLVRARQYFVSKQQYQNKSSQYYRCYQKLQKTQIKIKQLQNQLIKCKSQAQVQSLKQLKQKEEYVMQIDKLYNRIAEMQQKSNRMNLEKLGGKNLNQFQQQVSQQKNKSSLTKILKSHVKNIGQQLKIKLYIAKIPFQQIDNLLNPNKKEFISLSELQEVFSKQPLLLNQQKRHNLARYLIQDQGSTSQNISQNKYPIIRSTLKHLIIKYEIPSLQQQVLIKNKITKFLIRNEQNIKEYIKLKKGQVFRGIITYDQLREVLKYFEKDLQNKDLLWLQSNIYKSYRIWGQIPLNKLFQCFSF